ncbi:MAG: DUF420 domain-containing protein [Deltaproteobacteria bacterium]|nr:DUF420 domain-containing protein [Deltaproteobacteria bacterium]MBW2414843.1 DUF420 domain-containing protein [Deltaproteobacteria bacterium]
MDPKVAYWTAALVNMLATLALAFSGVAWARRGDYVRHRRRMMAAITLVVLFLLSYAVKVVVLGHEQLDVWPRLDVWVLRAHESFVAALVLAGGVAVGLALWKRMPVPQPRSEAGSRTHLWHRRAGRTALVGGVLGVLTAAFVLYGMYARMP